MMSPRRLALTICLCVLTTGCWNRREADQIDYVSAVGIDIATDGEISLTIQTPVLTAMKPKMGGSEEKFKTLSVKGKTVFEGIRNYIDVTGQKLFWGHTQMYIIGEEAARQGVEKFMDFFSADPELRGTSYIAVTKGNAKELLEAKPQFTAIPANYMSNLVRNAVLNGKSPTVMFSEFNRMLAEPTGSQPFLPVMDLMSQREYDLKHAGIDSKSSSGPGQSDIFYTIGTALFHNTKLIGFLNEKETRGLNWVKGKIKTTIVTLDCGADCKVSLELIGGVKVKQKVEMEGEKAKLKVKIKTNLNIGDRAGDVDVTKEDTLNMLEEGFSAVVKSEIEAAFRKASRKLHSDTMAFGNALSDKHPQVWEKLKDRWEEEILPAAELEIEVDGKIRRTSRTLYSPWVEVPKSGSGS